MSGTQNARINSALAAYSQAVAAMAPYTTFESEQNPHGQAAAETLADALMELYSVIDHQLAEAERVGIHTAARDILQNCYQFPIAAS